MTASAGASGESYDGDDQDHPPWLGWFDLVFLPARHVGGRVSARGIAKLAISALYR